MGGLKVGDAVISSVETKIASLTLHFTAGQGLGKKKNGISEAIKVKLKRDNSGVG